MTKITILFSMPPMLNRMGTIQWCCNIYFRQWVVTFQVVVSRIVLRESMHLQVCR